MKPRRALSGLFRRRAQNGPWNDGSFRVAKPRLFLSDRLTKLVENTYLYRAYRTRVRSNLVVFRRPEFHIWHSVRDVRRSWKKLHAILLSTFYYPHIVVRYLHDHLYNKSKKYRRYHDHPATETVHRAALAGFVASFLVFSFLQYGLPNIFNPLKPTAVQAGANSKIWTTRGDFQAGSANSNVLISGTNAGDDADASLVYTTAFTAISATGAPVGRSEGTAIWTGSKMIVWGGFGGTEVDTGGIYDPVANAWTTTSVTNAPLPRKLHGAVWTGDTGNPATANKMIIWGGVRTANATTYNTGGIYDPASNTWTTTSTVGAPSARYDHAVIWTGSKMIVWGGAIGSTSLNTGGIYDPATDTWAAISTLNAPSPRYGMSYLQNAIWTGSKMVIWGGADASGVLNTGGIYDPATNTWTPTSIVNVPPASEYYTSVWTGSKMIVWGGYNGTTAVNTGGIYDPIANNWVNMPTAGALSGRWSHKSVWTGSKMVIWGGYDGMTEVNTGGIYDPTANTWVSTPTIGAPSKRYSYQSVWTGSKMIIWGGRSGNTYPADAATLSDIYVSPGVFASFKYDAQSSVKWSNISWNGTTNASTAIKFRTRGADTEIGLASAVWSEYYTTSGAAINTASSRWLEAELTLGSSSGEFTPVINDFTISYDSLEAPLNTNLVMQKTDGSSIYTAGGMALTSGANGGLGYTNQTSLRVVANNLTCTDCSTAPTNLRPEVEIKPVGTAFDGTGTSTAIAGNNYAILTGLTTGTGYHIQVRAIDDQGRVSGWTSYGGNAESEADITSEQTAPTGTVSIDSGATYTTSTNVTLTTSATDTGGSNLSQMRFSNDGTTWSDWETYNTTKSWTLTTGDGDKTVYVQYQDNAGNQSGTWLQTSQADFQGGTVTGNVYKDDSSGLIKLVPGTQTVTLRPNGVGLYAQNGKYPDIGQNWEKVDEEINDPLDYVSSSDGTYKDLYNVQDVNLTTESVTSVKIYGAGQGNDNCGGGTANFSFGFYDGEGEYFATASDVAFSNLPSPAIYTVNPRTSLPWTISQINALQIGFNSVNTCAGVTVTQMYVEVSYAPIIASGEFISSSKDNLASSNYGAINWSANIPSGSGANALRFQIASNNDNSTWNFIGPDGTAITYYTASNTQLNTSHNGHRYIKYKVYFQTADSNYTPIVYDISVAVNTTSSDTVTLDTAPPVAVSGLKAYTDNTKTTQITDNTKWYTYATPYFEWSANTDADLKEYKYCFETSPSCTPATTTNLVTNYTADLAAAADGARSFRVVAVDNAGNPSTPVSIAYNFDKTLPGAVTGFTASSNDLTKITLSWNAFIAGQGAPLDDYKLERVKNSEYEANLWDMNSDWSTGAGYGVFVLTTSGYTDDSARIPDPVNPDPNLRQSAIETSVKYIYRITVKDQSNTQYSTPVTATGLTRDGRAPDDITGVKSAACDGTTTVITGTSVPRCSDVANKGFEIAITWNVTTDVGTGVSKYYIYRATSAPDVLASFAKIAETPAATSLYYDNDANNTANLTTPLNDFSTYYYRVTAIDNVGNESGLLPILDPTQNSTSATTPDVTAPTIPADVVATPMGLDGSDPTTPGGHQRVQITWSASSDIKARSTAAGSGVAGYKVYRADAEVGPYTDITTATGVTCDLTNRICTNDGLTGFTNYYYQILAFDNAVPTVNSSDLSLVVQVKTASDDVPGVPTGVTVNSIKGDPAQDARIGHNITMNFVGSSDKVYQITNYEVYRSTTNYSSAADWLDPAKATRLKLSLDLGCGTKCYVSDANGSDISVTPIQDDRNSTYTIKDSGLTDATTYYYKVRAKDNTPAVPDGGPFYSGLSAISVGTPTVGWNITPDVTAPIIPVGGLEVKVRDTHPNEFELRNIVTWKMLTAEQLPMRNGASDFARYEIHREVIDPNTGAIVSDTNVGNVSTLGNNYLIDIIPIAFADLKYRYYVMVVDDAATNFKYSSGAVINTYSNNSAKEYWTDSIVPSKVRPVLSGAVTLTSVGVSSAVVNWTTDQEADSLVQFRVKGSSDNWIAIGQVERSINHQVNLFGLKPTTQYEYQLVSRNYLGNNVEYDVSVLPPLTTSGFTITPGAVTTTTSTTEIAWETNLDASSAFVEYQLQRQVGDEPQGGTAGVDPSVLVSSPRNHKVVLKGLRSARAYTYKIKSISKDGFLSEYPSNEFATFRTKSFDSAQFTLAPSSSNVAERNITATTAQIVWQTENPTTSWVDYSTTSGTYDNASGNNDMVNTHVVVIEGLVPGTTYYYRVRVKDANEVEYTSQEYSFTAVLKPKLSNMTVKQVTPYSVTIAWDTNVDTETVINWGKTAAYGEKHGKSGTSKVHELTIDNLEDNQEYHYQILAKDSAGNEVADTDKVVRTPLDTVGPKISNVKVDILPMGENETTASVIISWQTDKPATTLVEYDVGIVGGDYNNRSVEDTSLSNSHTVIVKGLSPASSYRYRIISKDKRSNSTTSQDYTFVTPTKEKSILQLILKSLEETFAWTRNLDQFFSNIGKRLTGRSS